MTITRPRPRSAWLAVALAAAPLAAQDPAPPPPYTPTLTFGTGLVNSPVAWVSSTNGDLWLSASMRGTGEGPALSSDVRARWDMTLNADVHLFGRLSVGGSIYNLQSQQVGLFAQALLRRDDGQGLLPALAVGVRGLGASAAQDRFMTGARRIAQDLPAGRSAQPIEGNPSPYGVLTKELGSQRVRGSLSVGYGTGLFRNDGDMDTLYNRRAGTDGVFGGARLVITSRDPERFVTLVAEHDGWDVNAGVLATVRRVGIGLLVTEMEELGGRPTTKPLAGFRKVNLLFAYNGNLGEIIRGSRQRAEATELELQRQRLRREVEQREARMRELGAQIAKAAEKADAQSAAQRKALEDALQAERDALRKAAERLDKGRRPGDRP